MIIVKVKKIFCITLLVFFIFCFSFLLLFFHFLAHQTDDCYILLLLFFFFNLLLFVLIFFNRLLIFAALTGDGDGFLLAMVSQLTAVFTNVLLVVLLFVASIGNQEDQLDKLRFFGSDNWRRLIVVCLLLHELFSVSFIYLFIFFGSDYH